MNDPQLPGGEAVPDPAKIVEELEGGSAAALAGLCQALKALGIRPEDALATPPTPAPSPVPTLSPAEEIKQLLAEEAAVQKQLADLLQSNGIDPAAFFPAPLAVPAPAPELAPDAILKELVEGEAKALADLLEAVRNLGLDPKAFS